MAEDDAAADVRMGGRPKYCCWLEAYESADIEGDVEAEEESANADMSTLARTCDPFRTLFVVVVIVGGVDTLLCSTPPPAAEPSDAKSMRPMTCAEYKEGVVLALILTVPPAASPTHPPLRLGVRHGAVSQPISGSEKCLSSCVYGVPRPGSSCSGLRALSIGCERRRDASCQPAIDQSDEMALSRVPCPDGVVRPRCTTRCSVDLHCEYSGKREYSQTRWEAGADASLEKKMQANFKSIS